MASALLHKAAWRVSLHEACYDGHKQHATRYQDWLGKLNACFQTTFCEASVCGTKLPEHRQRGCIRDVPVLLSSILRGGMHLSHHGRQHGWRGVMNRGRGGQRLAACQLVVALPGSRLVLGAAIAHDPTTSASLGT